MDLYRNGRRRVVITGLGAQTPLGTLDSFWQNLLAGRSGVRRITQFDASEMGVQIAAEVDFDPGEHINPKEARRMARPSQMALVSARQALADAGLTQAEIASDGDRTAVVLGSVVGGFHLLMEGSYDYIFRGRRPNPFALLHGLPNIPAHLISLDMQATGPLETISTACASGTQSIGAATELIRSGRVDRVFTGGVDCLIRKEVIGAFDAMTVLSKHYNDTPELASRPFDIDRDGFVMGEGAGVLLLETLEQAQQRGARIYAEVLGHAASSDAYHSAAPDAEGTGAIKAMRWAIEDGGLNLDEVDYVNTHGTGTRLNDITETKAIKSLFGERAYSMLINSTKSMIGHGMGAAGALEAIACTLSIYHGVVHPTANLEQPDPECDLDYVPHEPRQVSLRSGLSNSFGLGGQNACLLLGKV